MKVDYANTDNGIKCDRCGNAMEWQSELRAQSEDEKMIYFIENWRCPSCNRTIMFRKKYQWVESETMGIR